LSIRWSAGEKADSNAQKKSACPIGQTLKIKKHSLVGLVALFG
jgi:hypothetical protein